MNSSLTVYYNSLIKITCFQNSKQPEFQRKQFTDLLEKKNCSVSSMRCTFKTNLDTVSLDILWGLFKDILACE